MRVPWGGPSFITIVWLVIGAIVARSHHYFAHTNTFKQVVSAALAVVLWPLLLLGIDLHIH
jgi:membrane protein YdbS with pleckstrin-like domain